MPQGTSRSDMSPALIARREHALQVFARYLQVIELDNAFDPICPGDGAKPPRETRGIENTIAPSTLDLWARDRDGRNVHNARGRNTDCARSVRQLHYALKRDAGIASTVINANNGSQGHVTRLLIDTEQPDFASKVHDLLNKATRVLVFNAREAQAGRVQAALKYISAGVPLDMDGKPMSQEQAAELIAAHMAALKGLAAEMGVGKMLEAHLSPRTGRALSQGGDKD